MKMIEPRMEKYFPARNGANNTYAVLYLNPRSLKYLDGHKVAHQSKLHRHTCYSLRTY